MTENAIYKNLKAYPVLRRRFREYIQGVQEFPQGFTPRKLFYDYLKVRRANPEKRVSMSEYMIFGFYNKPTEEQKKYLTDVEATLLMRPYNSESEPFLKNKAEFMDRFSKFIHRDWLYLPDSNPEEFMNFLRKHESIALKPALSSWGIGFRKLSIDEVDDPVELFNSLLPNKYMAEEFLVSDHELAKYHPESLNTLRVITFIDGDRFEVFGAGLRVGNNGLHVDNAHGGGIFCEIDVKTGKIITDGLDECGNYYEVHPMTNVRFKGQQIPYWDKVVDLCHEASKTLPCLHVVGWDVAILPGGQLELIEGNHNPGMNIVQAPAKHGVHDKFANMLLDFYGPADEFLAANANI